jgi:hypothetical protein
MNLNYLEIEDEDLWIKGGKDLIGKCSSLPPEMIHEFTRAIKEKILDTKLKKGEVLVVFVPSTFFTLGDIDKLKKILFPVSPEACIILPSNFRVEKMSKSVLLRKLIRNLLS